MATAFLAVVFFDLSSAIACWVALLFLVNLSALGRGPTLVGILLVLAWLGARALRPVQLPVLRSHSRLFMGTSLFACWLAMSIVWAERTGRAATEAGFWCASALAFLVVTTTLKNIRDVRLVALAFVIGSTVSAAIGFLGIGVAAAAAAKGASYEQRLVAGGADPNYQAAAFLAGMFLAGGLLGVFRRRAARIALALTLAFITLAFFATESRGGLLALGFALLVGFVLLPQQRIRILACAMVAGLGFAIWLPSHPQGLHRLTHFSAEANGRQDEWTVAWRIFSRHPVVGVGIGNYRFTESRYVLEPGKLAQVRLIAEERLVVHNAYLQLLAETGVVGLAAFLIVTLGSLRASWSAAKRFDAIGETDYANLARAVLLGTIGMLAAMFFISDANDYRLWVLFALGPVLLTIAKHPPVDAMTGATPRSSGASVTTAARGATFGMEGTAAPTASRS
jgi:O-antigen ligase